ncbi:hypothetical protein E2C01_000152 [Portunus trituberculatus]|uniref:Uncharacterized protein n=1 Tax=Portunus trituberculatus TaxID=210409 RepID=A0A5B7CDJ3_PORTR|nr:hypothetical protein [Portunus trituberculatus]
MANSWLRVSEATEAVTGRRCTHAGFRGNTGWAPWLSQLFGTRPRAHPSVRVPRTILGPVLNCSDEKVNLRTVTRSNFAALRTKTNGTGGEAEVTEGVF